MVALTDAFSNNATTTTEIGASPNTWNGNSSNWRTTADGKAYVVNVTGVQVALRSTPTNTPDQRVGAWVTSDKGLALRFADPNPAASGNSGYHLRIELDHIEVFGWFAAFLGSVNLPGGATFPGFLEAEVSDDGVSVVTIECFWNGVSIGSVTDTGASSAGPALLSGKYAGISSQGNTTSDSTVDDWEAADTGPADVTAPVISAVAYDQITDTSARVTWTTDEDATSTVDYGTTTGVYGSQEPNPDDSAAESTSHAVALSGLTADTLYYARVRSSDASGNEATGSEFTFRTAIAGSGSAGNVYFRTSTGTWVN